MAPPPDSLRAPLRGATTPAARAAVWLRVANAFIGIADSAALGYLRAVLGQARQTADPLLRGVALDLLGAYYLAALDEHRALPVLEEARRLLATAPLPEQAVNLIHLGIVYNALNRPGPAIASYRRAAILYHQEGNAPAQAQTFNDIGLHFLSQNQSDSAAIYLFRALRQFQALKRPDDAAATMLNLSGMYYNQDRPARAATYARRAYAIQQPLGDSVVLMQTLNFLGSIAYSRDSLPAALGYFRAAQGILRRRPALYGYAPRYFGNIAAVFRRLHQPDSADYYYRRSLRETQRLGEGESLEAGQTMGMMAEFYRSVNRLPEAATFARRARRIALGGQAWADAQWAVRVLRRVAEQQHDYRAALAFSQEELQLDSTQQVSENRQVTEGLRVQYETERAEQQQRLSALRADQAAARARQYALVASGLLVLLVGGGGLLVLLTRSRRRLQTSEAALRVAHNTQQELMRIIGHDLRGPVATFQQITPLLHHALGPAPSADATELVAELDGTAQRLGGLVDNLLHWARVQGGLVKRDPRPVPAALALANVVGLYEPVARHKSLLLTSEVVPSPGLTFTTDLDLLLTVLRNLVGNAVKFTPSGGTVAVRAAADTAAGQVLFSVTDSGPGMTAAALAAAFGGGTAPSQRGTAGETGTGLGLPLCHRFVALLGGELRAEANPAGGGMRFWFALPA